MNKKSVVLRSFLALILMSCCMITRAQDMAETFTKQEIRVKKHTVLEQYEPAMVIPVEERLQLKNERLATIKERRIIIDTLDISDRKRRRLLKELYRSPFSYKWDKVITNIQAEEEEDEEH